MAAAQTKPDEEIVRRLDDPEKYGGVFTVIAFILTRLRQLGLAFDQVLRPGRRGVHPQNRGSYGINHSSVHALGRDIIEMGWSWQELGAESIAVQDDPVDSYVQVYNAKIAAGSDKLAPCPPRSIDAGTLTNGHTTLFLRALDHGVPCDIPEISVDGRMAKHSLIAADPELGVAISTGWKWTVLHHSTRHLYGPRLFEFLSDIRNVSVNRPQSEMQVLLKIFNAADQCKRENRAIPWEDIARSIHRLKPACEGYVNTLVAFVKSYGPFVPDLAAFHAKFIPHERVVPGAFFQSLLSLTAKKSGVEHKLPLLRCALLKAEYGCPSAKVVNKHCAFITNGDISACGRKAIDTAIAAESVLRKARETVEQVRAHLTDETVTRLYGQLDCNMARFVVQKQKTSTVEFKSVQEVGYTFWQELSSQVGDKCPANPWPTAGRKEPEPVVEQPSFASQGPEGMASYSALGDLLPADSTDYLKRCGFKAGCTIANKKQKGQKEKATIASIGNGDVTVKLADDSEETFDVKKFLATFGLFEEETYPFEDEYTGKTNKQYQEQAARGHICWLLASLTHAHPTPNVTMFRKPARAVFAATDYSAGELVLIPESTGIVIVKPVDTPPKNAVHVGDDLFGTVGKVCIMPPTLSTEKTALNSPFWIVRRCEDAAAANMKLEEATVSSTVKVKASERSTGIKILVMKNKVAVKAGDELVVFLQGAEAEESGQLAASSSKGGKGAAKKKAAAKPKAQPPAKRQRS